MLQDERGGVKTHLLAARERRSLAVVYAIEADFVALRLVVNLVSPYCALLPSSVRRASECLVEFNMARRKTSGTQSQLKQ